MSEVFCTQCGHDPLLQADNDRRNREELEAAKAGIEYIRAMNLILSNRLGEAQAEIKHLTEQMYKLAHLANEKNAAVIAEMYIADWDAIRAETAQARTRLAEARAIILDLVKTIDASTYGEDILHHHTCPAPDHGKCTCGAYEAMDAARLEEYKGMGMGLE